MSRKHIIKLHAVVSRALFETGSSLNYCRTIEAITRLAEAVNDSPESGEALDGIGEHTGADLWSLLIGAYWFCAEYHTGAKSLEYAALSAIGRVFTPGAISGPESESSEQGTYEALENLLG